MMIKRDVSEKVMKYADQFPIITITGRDSEVNRVPDSILYIIIETAINASRRISTKSAHEGSQALGINKENRIG